MSGKFIFRFSSQDKQRRLPGKIIVAQNPTETAAVTSSGRTRASRKRSVTPSAARASTRSLRSEMGGA